MQVDTSERDVSLVPCILHHLEPLADADQDPHQLHSTTTSAVTNIEVFPALTAMAYYKSTR
jgi:hypothetical protein